MRVLEGATESLKRRIAELGAQRNYLRQEEITEEMLEILSSGVRIDRPGGLDGCSTP